MELKDVILSTLAEMEDNEATKEILNTAVNKKEELPETKQTQQEINEVKDIQEPKLQQAPVKNEVKASTLENELTYLNSMRERLLVLFEGFQAPNNANLEAKIDLTLNFLEYILSNIDNRIQKLEENEKGNINESM